MDQKITQLSAVTSYASPDLLHIVTNPNGTPVNKKITTKAFFGAVSSNVSVTSATVAFAANTTINGLVVFNNNANSAHDFRVRTTGDTAALFVDAGNNHVGIGTQTPQVKFDVNSDKVRLRTSKTPSTSNAATESVPPGTIFWDSNYIYVAVDANTIKRATLDSF